MTTLISSNKVLGFTGKFYAVWTVNVETYSPYTGCDKTITRYIYGRKVSKYQNIAEKKMPGLPILEVLENKNKTFCEWETTYTGVKTFHFGKYRGQNINECNDMKYLEWYYKTIDNNDQKRYILKVFEAHGYVIETKEVHIGPFVTKKMSITTPEELKAQSDMQIVIKRIENQKAITERILRYPNAEGIYSTPAITYKFPEVIAHYYDGYAYYMPAIKGKSKRVKNKVIEITKCTYTIENSHLTINILEWNIKK